MSNPPNRRRARLLFGLALIAALFWFARREGPQPQMTARSGQTMGTVPYSIKAIASRPLDLQGGVDSLLRAFNQSLSTYIPDSEISRFNRNDTLVFESDLFLPVLQASQEVVKVTDGAFDPTVGPLVNAWGFGPEGVTHSPDSSEVDSLLALVNFSSVSFTDDYVAKRSGMYLDFSAIAKGYAVDLVGLYLEGLGVEHYMVEIGGEVRTKGANMEGNLWRIGIEDPLVSRYERKLLAIVSMEDNSLATSGNYRNYYEKDGEIFAHIVDPRTGYNNFNNILSASVFARDCMEADAYATAFMVMGVSASVELVEGDPGIEAVLIYREGDETKTYVSTGLEEYVTLNLDQQATGE